MASIESGFPIMVNKGAIKKNIKLVIFQAEKAEKK